jgi:GNAT superfamily N-acetyltransferase
MAPNVARADAPLPDPRAGPLPPLYTSGGRRRRASRILILDQMGVAARHRSRGIGHALWNAVRETAAAERVDRVILNVWSFNRDARRFYERLGFTAFHERMAFELEQPAGESR